MTTYLTCLHCDRPIQWSSAGWIHSMKKYGDSWLGAPNDRHKVEPKVIKGKRWSL